MFVLLWTKMSGGHSRMPEQKWAQFDTAEAAYRVMSAHPDNDYIVIEGEVVNLEATIEVKRTSNKTRSYASAPQISTLLMD